MKTKISELIFLGDHILLLEDKSTMATSGLIVPETSDKYKMAQVVAMGDGFATKKGESFHMPYKVGNWVLINRYSAQSVEDNGTKYLLARASDIIAVMGEQKNG